MKIRLKPLRDQTVVITGATSGIGLALARKLAARGARMVLAARDGPALDTLVGELTAAGAEAVAAVTDVGQPADVHRLADIAMERFGGFDTWVNNAGVSIFGTLSEVTLEDHHRLFDTNYWGVVHGSLVAVHHLRRRGGALINVGSVAGDRAVPVQGAYSASKHAVKGFTESLRMELEHERAPVAVTLIKPASMDTPLHEHAKNYLAVEPRTPPPVYAVELAADAILHAAEHPMRDVSVGASGRLMALMGNVAPRLTDRLMEGTLTRYQRTARPADPRERNSLYSPSGDGEVHGRLPARVIHSGLVARGARHPLMTAGIAVGVGWLAWRLMSARSGHR